MCLLILQTGCSIGILWGTIFYMPLYFHFVREESAVQSGTHMLPHLLTTLFSMLVSERLIIKIGKSKYWFIAGTSLTLICQPASTLPKSTLLTASFTITSSLEVWGPAWYAMNAGPVMAAIVPEEHVADASAICLCVDTLCGALEVGIANGIFVNQASNSIQKILSSSPRATVQEATTSVGASLTDELPPELATAIVQVVSDTIKNAWIQMVATAVISLVLAFFPAQ